jgi:hypothetical protein
VSTRYSSLPALFTTAALCLHPGAAITARAEGDPAREALAETLFNEGRALMKDERYAEACSKFAESERLDAGVGILFFLGDCYEKNGQTASAWTTFKSALARARAAGQSEREQSALQRIGALEARLSKLAVVVPPQTDVRGLEVSRDGLLINPALWGSPVPVDPGRHVVEARAQGRVSFRAEVQIEPGPDTTTVEIPVLVESSSDPPALAAPASPVAASSRAAEAPRANRGLGSQRVTAIALGAGGLVAVGVGTFFGLRTFAVWEEAQAHCRAGTRPLRCEERGLELSDQAETSATVSTIAFSLGGVALAAGTVLWLTSPAQPRPGRALRPHLRAAGGQHGGQLVVSGSF